MKQALSGLALLVASCTTIPSNEEPIEEIPVYQAIALQIADKTTSNTELAFRITSFDFYQPPPAKERILLDPLLKNVVTYGTSFFDNSNWHEHFDESYILEDAKNFTRVVLEDAAKLGYSNEDIASMSSHTASELACLLSANRFEYFGTKQRKEISAIREFLVKLGSELKMVKSELDPKLEQRLALYTSIPFEFTKIERELSWIERTLDNHAGPLAVDQDKAGLEMIYLLNLEGVCRHYAKESVLIFEKVFKPLNPGLANSYLSCHTNGHLPNHLWNQAITITESENTIQFHIAYLDPTAKNGGGALEAFDPVHFDPSTLPIYDLARLGLARGGPPINFEIIPPKTSADSSGK